MKTIKKTRSITLLGMLMCFIIGSFFLYKELTIRVGGVKTLATVVDIVKSEEDRGSITYIPVFNYELEGVEMEYKPSYSTSIKYQKNEKKYLYISEKGVSIGGFNPNLIISSLTFGSGFVLLLIFLISIFNERKLKKRFKYLRKFGNKVKVKCIEKKLSGYELMGRTPCTLFFKEDHRDFVYKIKLPFSDFSDSFIHENDFYVYIDYDDESVYTIDTEIFFENKVK